MKSILKLTVFLLLVGAVAAYALNYSDKIVQKQDAQLASANTATESFLEAERIKDEAEKAAEKIYLLGKFDPSKRDDFVVVPAKYNAAGYKSYLRKETLSAFVDMALAAESEGVELNIASATRNFDYQRKLWNKKWEGITLVEGKNLSKSILDRFTRMNKILEYSAIPGTSRHHWGTDIDIDSAVPQYFNTVKGKIIYSWLLKNAGTFGFCQPYSVKGPLRPTGYNEEKWHWSYVPLSQKFTEDYKILIANADIKGFDGDELAKNIDLVNDYVEDVNPDCL